MPTVQGTEVVKQHPRQDQNNHANEEHGEHNDIIRFDEMLTSPGENRKSSIDLEHNYKRNMRFYNFLD